MLGLKQSLTPSRSNGFLNMLCLMQRKAAEIMAAGAAGTQGGPAGAAGGAGHGEASGLQVHPSPAPSSVPTPVATSSGRQSSSSHSDGNGSSNSHDKKASSSGGSREDATGAAGACLSSEEIQGRMQSKLTAALQPSSLVIVDESPDPKQSRQSAALGIAPLNPKEVHLRLQLVSAAFEGMSKVKRQRWVYEIVQEEFSLGLHALSLETKAPSEL